MVTFKYRQQAEKIISVLVFISYSFKKLFSIFCFSKPPLHIHVSLHDVLQVSILSRLTFSFRSSGMDECFSEVLFCIKESFFRWVCFKSSVMFSVQGRKQKLLETKTPDLQMLCRCEYQHFYPEAYWSLMFSTKWSWLKIMSWPLKNHCHGLWNHRPRPRL